MGKARDQIDEVSQDLLNSILDLEDASLDTPVRSLSNVDYNEDDGYFDLQGSQKQRKLSANTAKTFAQTLRLMALSKELIETEDIATKREAYYVSKNWDDAKFDKQDQSDNLMDDVEAMFRVNREQLGFIADEGGGSVAGELVVVDEDPSTGEKIEIDCTDFGSGSYSVPSDVEHLEFKTDADFVLAVETRGMYERLNKHRFWEKQNCILVSMGGVPARACRRFIRRLSDQINIPVYVFTDGDPYGYLNIYRTLKVGSGNAAHINKHFCVPRARFLGITPDDIEEYNLPTHELEDVDKKRINDGLSNDPFVKHHESWQEALNQLNNMGVRAEQQSLAKHGLNFVISDYLPEKLSREDDWLA